LGILFVGEDVAFVVVFVVVFVEVVASDESIASVASDESIASGDGKCGWDIRVDFYGENKGWECCGSSGEERMKRRVG
jgi:hypothetical protein